MFILSSGKGGKLHGHRGKWVANMRLESGEVLFKMLLFLMIDKSESEGVWDGIGSLRGEEKV